MRKIGLGIASAVVALNLTACGGGEDVSMPDVETERARVEAERERLGA